MRITVFRQLLFALPLTYVIFAQHGDFDLPDLNPASDTYDQIIGPDDYLDDICIVYFGHEY